MSFPDATRCNVIAQRNLSPEELKFYKTEGYLLLPQLLSFEHAEMIRREIMDIMKIIGLPLTALRQTHEYHEGSRLDRLINNSDLRSIASQLMEGPGSLYLPFTAVKSGGGGGRFYFHQDNQYTRFDGPGINLWFALKEMTADNGCLQIVPRSHLNGTLEYEHQPKGKHRKIKFEPSDFISILMQPGDCVAFSRLTLHGSGQNITTQARVGYAIQFHRNDVKAAREGESKRLLTEHPRYNVKPVTSISVPKGKTEGH